MHRLTIALFAGGILTVAVLAQTGSAKVKTREFLFTYAGAVKELPAGTKARVWMPMAVSNAQQEVSVVSQKVPAGAQIGHDKPYGNQVLSFEGVANEKGEIPFEITYRVKRKEVKTDFTTSGGVPVGDGEKVNRFLKPDAKVPIDGKPLDLLKESLKGGQLPKDPFTAARVMYDLVNKHMTYKKIGTGWGQGDSVWACDSKYGNCTDFHSLFISMARGNKIGAKFEMGFSVPTKAGSGPIGGYHCWAWFLPEGKAWIPVDISEANQHPELTDYFFGNLNENRVAFSVGRDIDLEPPQQGPSLNYFIYPYVEVDGKTYPAEKVQRAFSYKDVP
jgi:transglutaminase-like putative cysteine protease